MGIRLPKAVREETEACVWSSGGLAVGEGTIVVVVVVVVSGGGSEGFT